MRFLIDEDFDNRIFRGLVRRIPELDIIRVQDTDVATSSDPTILEWATTENRVLLTHDVNTMTYYFKRHLEKGHTSPGILFVPQTLPISIAIDELVLVAKYSVDGEYENQLRFIPLD